MDEYKPTPYFKRLKVSMKNAFTTPILDSFERRDAWEALTTLWYVFACLVVRVAIMLTFPISIPVLTQLIALDERKQFDRNKAWKEQMREQMQARGRVWGRDE